MMTKKSTTRRSPGRRGLLVAGLLVAVLVAVSGCPPKPEGEVIARVGDDYLTKDEFEALVPEGFDVTRENLPKILDKWVSNSLMYQEAKRRGVDKEDEVQHSLKRLERDYLVNEMLGRLTSLVSVSQAQMLDYFDARKDEFNYDVKITRIVLADSALAAKTLWEIRQGGDFKKLAKERSQDMLLEPGQETKYLEPGIGDPRLGGDPDVEEAIFSLEVGEVSDVIASQEGYQIIKLVDKKKVRSDVAFGEKKEYIEAVLTYRQSQAFVDSVLTSLREDAKIELLPEVYFQ